MIDTNMKILVVEDEDALRDMLVMILQDEDYLVDESSNGEEAWEFLSNNTYDLLITDLFMPVMNGVDLILKCQQAIPSLKIILISGGGKEVFAKHGDKMISFNKMNIKVDCYLKKPYKLNDMLTAVEGLLKN